MLIGLLMGLRVRIRLPPAGSRVRTSISCRRFLIHVLPDGFHRIRHYGLFANANRAAISHWPGSSSACPQPRRAVRAIAPNGGTQTESGTLVLAAAGV
jgi:hypothetical protein